MKKLLLIFGLSLITLSAWCQGNLQFNQVKLVGTTLETVPSGKVWKVESATYTGGQAFPINSETNYASYASMSFYLNGIQNYEGYFTSVRYGSVWVNSTNNQSTFPLWIPAGSTLKAGSNMNSLSVIEYNIIP
jgi:hypothetical protein